MFNNRFYYGWIIVAISFVSVFFALGTRFSFGVFYVAILKEFSWSRAETAGVFSLAMLVHAGFSPVSGYLIDRFGPRLLFPGGAGFLALGLFAASKTASLWQLYLFFGIMIAAGVNTLSYTPHMALISKWFSRKRGTANGMVLAGIGLGMMGLAPFIQFIIDRMGWRSAFLVLAIIISALIIPLTVIFQRGSPQEVGQQIDGGSSKVRYKSGKKHRNENVNRIVVVHPQNWALHKIFRSRNFWFLGLATFTTGFVANLMVVHQAAYIVGAGYSPVFAASLVGVTGLIGSIGGVFGGMLSDRFSREISYTFSCLLATVGVIFLACVKETSMDKMLFAFVFLYGLGYGSMLPINAARTGDLFSGGTLGRILGFLSAGYGVGGALGAFIGGYLFDLTGSYYSSFALVVFCLALGSFGMWMVGNRALSAKT